MTTMAKRNRTCDLITYTKERRVLNQLKTNEETIIIQIIEAYLGGPNINTSFRRRGRCWSEVKNRTLDTYSF